MTTVFEILQAARVGETTDWEFKSAKGGLPGSLWETYSAMANTEGGVIVLGVREDGDQARFDGLDSAQIAKYHKLLWDTLHDRGKISLNLLSAHDIAVVNVQGADLLTITIPRATRTQRPVYLGSKPFGNTFKRRHEGDYHCLDAEVRRMLADADEAPVDSRILTNFGMEDLDGPSLTQYRQRFRAAKGDHPWLALEDKDLLTKLGGRRRDRASGEEGLTLAGLIMFGKEQAIRDIDAVSEYFVDYREKLDPAVRWTHREYPDGTWEANLFQFFQRVWPRLSAGITSPFQLSKGVRRDETPAHEALREAFVNALIHADYFVPGGIVIERYPEKFVMENPGTLLVSLEQYHRGAVSECRNKALQQMFIMIGGGERAGSGVDKIRSGWRTRHWRAPKIELLDQPDRVSLSLPMLSLIPDEVLATLHEHLGPAFDALSPLEVQALATAQLEGWVSNTRLQELVPDHPVDITRCLQGLCQRGWLVSDNRRRWSQYRLDWKNTEGPLFPFQDEPLTQAGGSLQIGGDSLQMAQDSTHLPESSIHLAPGAAESGMEGQDQALLEQLAEPVRSAGKVSEAVMRGAILSLCRGRFLTAGRLGELLNRDSDNLRSRFLSPLVKEKRLRLLHEDLLNHPDQAYQTLDEAP